MLFDLWIVSSDLHTRNLACGHFGGSTSQPGRYRVHESTGKEFGSWGAVCNGPVGMGVWKNAQEDGSWMKLMEMELFHIKNRCVLSFQEITSNILKFTGEYTATKPNMELKRAEASSAWKGKKRSLFLAPLG